MDIAQGSCLTTKSCIEEEIWNALEMDDLKDQMTTEMAPGENSVMMGTGSTHNACYACSNSNTTAGCGTCSM
jgi:hypothetical protein